MSDEINKSNNAEEAGLEATTGLEDELSKCRAERDEYLAGWQRAKADFINYKKEELKRLEDAAKYQIEDVIYEMVSVLDNFDLAISAMEKQGQVEKGVYLIRGQLEDALKRRGLQKITVSPGEEMDPVRMEAVAVAEAEGPPNRVLEVIETGYKLYEKVLRPARVKVSKNNRE